MTQLFHIIVRSPDNLEGELFTELTRVEALAVFEPADPFGRTPIERLLGRQFQQKAVHCYGTDDGYQAFIRPIRREAASEEISVSSSR